MFSSQLNSLVFLYQSLIYIVRGTVLCFGPTMAVPYSQETFVGKMFGYTIDFIQKLGRRSFGTVYKGRDDTQSIIFTMAPM